MRFRKRVGKLEILFCISVVVCGGNIMKGYDGIVENISFNVKDGRRVFWGDIAGGGIFY